MPNWCNNTMLVKGTPEQIEEFVEQMVSNSEKGDHTDVSALDFDAVVPMPRVLRGRTSPADDGSITWYDWAIDNWGTKWNACAVHIEQYTKGDNSALYHYKTAWSPAEHWQMKVIECFPWLKFEFYWEEPDMNFCGGMKGKYGQWDDNWCRDHIEKTAYDHELDKEREEREWELSGNDGYDPLFQTDGDDK